MYFAIKDTWDSPEIKCIYSGLPSEKNSIRVNCCRFNFNSVPKTVILFCEAKKPLSKIENCTMEEQVILKKGRKAQLYLILRTEFGLDRTKGDIYIKARRNPTHIFFMAQGRARDDISRLLAPEFFKKGKKEPIGRISAIGIPAGLRVTFKCEDKSFSEEVRILVNEILTKLEVLGFKHQSEGEQSLPQKVDAEKSGSHGKRQKRPRKGAVERVALARLFFERRDCSTQTNAVKRARTGIDTYRDLQNHQDVEDVLRVIKKNKHEESKLRTKHLAKPRKK